MSKDDALKMAIEDLEVVWGKDRESVIACRKALEQPTQEPVAWIIQTQKIDGEPTEPYAMMGKYKYAADTCDFGQPIPLYTHPKEWQRLSDDEILDIKVKAGLGNWYDFSRAIETKLKEKNT